ncbi:MAG: type I methionyl aminopeptidase [Fimbriimonadaceae bacterium]|nr:type I methionyl aminopeptidase [Fimbriimonadaceae bacterium]
MILYKSTADIAKMREAGRIVARTMREVAACIAPGVTTKELDAMAGEKIRAAGGVPSFKDYRGYPADTCISVNEMVVHGIPNDRPLGEGDIVTLDFGVILDGWHADGAWTYPVGKIAPNAQRLMNITREALMQGIAKAKAGNRVGDIASTVQRYCESNGYGVVTELVGHGIGRKLHEEPSIPNVGRPGKGEPIRPGMTFCVEPMINEGTADVRYLDDKWTVVTADGKLSAHFEHTVAVTKEGPVILTQE